MRSFAQRSRVPSTSPEGGFTDHIDDTLWALARWRKTGLREGLLIGTAYASTVALFAATVTLVWFEKLTKPRTDFIQRKPQREPGQQSSAFGPRILVQTSNQHRCPHAHTMGRLQQSVDAVLNSSSWK